MWLLVGLWACAPVEPPAAVCEGARTLRLDGEVGQTGRRVVDADGHILEEETWIDGRPSTFLLHDWHDGLLARTRIDTDDDDAFEIEELYWYDGDLPFLVERTSEGQTERTEHAYDRDGNRTETVVRVSGDLESVDRWTWIDGRMHRLEQSGPDGVVFATTEWRYPDPAPSLDHEMTVSSDLGEFDAVTFLRGFDADGRQVWEEVHPLHGDASWSSLRWDGERLVESWYARRGVDGGVMWAHATRDFGDDALLDRYVSDQETTRADGTVDASHLVEDWTWDCAPG